MPYYMPLLKTIVNVNDNAVGFFLNLNVVIVPSFFSRGGGGGIPCSLWTPLCNFIQYYKLGLCAEREGTMGCLVQYYLLTPKVLK